MPVISGTKSLSVAVQRAKYISRGYDARKRSEELLGEALGIAFTTSEWSGRTFAALAAQWDRQRFDWARIARAVRTDPSRLDVSVWLGDRLCCLFVATLGGESVTLRWVEGDPRADCPLRGRRLLIALDIATNYAQRNGRHEIRVEPIDDAMLNLFERTYGFAAVKPKHGSPYWTKQV